MSECDHDWYEYTCVEGNTYTISLVCEKCGATGKEVDA